MTETDSPPPVFDRDGMLDRLGGDDRLLVEILSLFRDESVPLVDELHAAIAADDPTRVRGAAHAMRGALLNVGALAAAEAASHVEWAGTAGDVAAARDALRRLDTELDRLSDELSA